MEPSHPIYIVFLQPSFHTQVADRWLVPPCVEACFSKLTTIARGCLTMEDALAVYCFGRGPLPPSVSGAPTFQPILKAADAILMQHFGDIPNTTSSSMLTEGFLALPHAAVLALLSSEKLLSDCEDSVFMLLSWWLEGEQGVNCPECMVTELRDTIRFSRLSSSYLAQALPLVPKLCPTAAQLADLHQFRSYSADYAALYAKLDTTPCPSAWYKTRRPTTPIPDSSSGSENSGINNISANNSRVVTIGLNAPRADFKAHLACQGRVTDRAGIPALYLEKVHHMGLTYELLFPLPLPDHRLAASARVLLRLPKCSSRAHLPLGIPGTCTMTFQTKSPVYPPLTHHSPASFIGAHTEVYDFALEADERKGDLMDPDWWEPFMISGHIRLKAVITDGRTD